MTDTKFIDEGYILASKALHDLAEELKAMGESKNDVWALIWSVYQDLSAMDLVVGSDDYEEHISAPVASLLEGAISSPSATSS